MIPDWQTRTAMLAGEDGLARLRSARVAVVGIGGVGAAAAEMLVRAGVGHLLIVDSDCVSDSNRNRQILALCSTVGRPKCEVLAERLLDINPELELRIAPVYVSESNIAQVLGYVADGAGGTGTASQSLDFVVDAIDTLSPKIALIQYCLGAGIPLVSSMGSGAKMDATAVRLADISKTRMCPLAHMLRKRLHKFGIRSGFLAVYSEEQPRRESVVLEESINKKSQVGTISYLPAVFGCVCAQAVIREMLSSILDSGITPDSTAFTTASKASL